MSDATEIANMGAGIGRQLMGTINARDDGYNRMAKFLSDASLKQAQGDFYQQKANSERQRAQYQKPEFASKIAASLAGLSDPQASEMDAFTKNGNWGVTPGYSLPENLSGPTTPAVPKAAPDWATPQVKERYNAGRTAQLLNLAGTGDSKADDLQKAIGGILSRGDYDSSKTSPDALLKYAQAQYAQKGGAPFSQDGTGVLNVLEGGFSAKPEWQAVQKSAAGENNAQAASAYASANNSNANARLHLAQLPEVQSRIDLNKSKIGADQVIINPDGTEVITGPAMPKLTEIQAKSQLFGSRAVEADRIMREIEGKYSPLALNTKLGAEGAWGVGGILGAIGNKALPQVAQKAEQAQRDFINAILRQESGAAIAESEFDNARKQYFPQPNNGSEVLKQKEINRKTAIEGLKVMAGPASRLVNYDGRRPSAENQPTPDRVSALSEAKAAIAAGAPRAAVIQRLKEMGIKDGAI